MKNLRIFLDKNMGGLECVQYLETCPVSDSKDLKLGGSVTGTLTGMQRTHACPLPSGERVLSKLNHGGVPSALLWTGSAAAAEEGWDYAPASGVPSASLRTGSAAEAGIQSTDA